VLGKAPGFRLDENGTLWFGKRICVPEVKAIRDTIGGMGLDLIMLILYTLEVPRCIWILKRSIGGMG
jgi:hypothetical protein